MDAIDTVKTFMTALQAGDLELAAQYMSDDFSMSGWTAQPIGRGEFLAMQSALHAAMPDLSYQLQDLREERDGVTGLMALSGTHMQDLSLPMFGIPLIPATGIAVALPQVYVEYTFDDGEVKVMLVEEVRGGGLTGLLQQIGTELPVLPRLGDDDIRRLNESGETSI